jgi:coenzyme F420-0:L-glutamate ligase/coenzyme F420-1:gamma-L-glutamate ligase
MRLLGLTALPEVTPGMDLAELARDAVRDAGETFHDGDVLVVTHKIVAKAEGRLVDLGAIEPSDFAREWAAAWS